MENATGITVIEESAPGVTETPALPEIAFHVAVTVTLPDFRAVSTPLALTTATVGSELFQTA